MFRLSKKEIRKIKKRKRKLKENKNLSHRMSENVINVKLYK